MKDEMIFAEALKKVSELGKPEIICALSEEQKAEYIERLNYFKLVNNGKYSASKKGQALEELVNYLLRISGNIFSVKRNVRTHTNEIDQLVELNDKGKILLSHGVLPKRFEHFLGECKNFSRKIGVTYVGKFYSLLLTTSETTGLLFSYRGLSGKNWSDAAGLVRKIYLQRENEVNRVAIIDFSLVDFEKIAEGDNFINLIEFKLKALKYDTSVDCFIGRHSAETLLGSI